MGERIDLNAARAARAEARKESPSTIVIGEDEYELPVEMPVALLEAFGRAQNGDGSGFTDGVIALLGSRETYESLLEKHNLTMEDLVEVMEGAMASYGVTPGESPASPSSSPATTRPSRPTSSASTKSTSAKRSTASASK